MVDRKQNESKNLPVPAHAGSRLPARDLGIAVDYPSGPAAYAAEPAEGAEELSLIGYWRILRRRRGALLLAAFLGVMAGALVTVPQTPLYQAKATLEVQDMNQNFLNMKEVSPISEMGASYTALTDVQTQIKLIQSATLLSRTSARLRGNGAQTVKAQPSRWGAWRKALNLPEQKPVDGREQMLQSLQNSLRVRSAGQTRIIEMLVDSTDPNLAAAFANLLCNEYIDQNMEARWQMSQRTGDWLGRQLEDMRIKLERSEDGLQSYARQTGLLFTGDKDRQNISEEKLRQLQAQLSTVQGDRVAKQSRYEMARTASADTLPDVLSDSSLRELMGKVTDLRRQEADLAELYTPSYGKLKQIRAQIVSLERALAQERQAILARIRNEYEEAQGREKLLLADYTSQSHIVAEQAEKSIQYSILKREVDSNRDLYDSMLQRVKESSVAGALRASNIRVVDAAIPPKLPYRPLLSLNAGLGLLAGLFFGGAFVVMRERANRTIQEPGESAAWLNVPELGIIPIATGFTRRRLSYYRKKPSDSPARRLLGEAVPFNQNIEMVERTMEQRRSSIVAESFRATLTSILFSGKGNGGRPHVLVVTSAGPGEGKTTVCCNLASALAEIGQRVLLVDADLRRPRVHQIFGLENEIGLGGLLAARPMTDEALAAVVQPTQLPNLFALPAGPSTSAAASLLYSANMKTILDKLREQYDMVLVDTPPALHMPDSRVLGGLADAVVLVLRAGATTRDAALAVRQRLAADDIRVLGTILDGWNPQDSPGGYYGHYNGAYYKGYSKYYNESYSRDHERVPEITQS